MDKRGGFLTRNRKAGEMWGSSGNYLEKVYKSLMPTLAKTIRSPLRRERGEKK